MEHNTLESGTLPLSVLFDQLAGDGPRDQHFVREFVAWLQARADHLSFGLAQRYELEDVVATFHMRQRVKLVITGYPPAPFVGDVTLRVDEEDFTRVMVSIRRDPLPSPYEFCTLDYFAAGAKVRVEKGSYKGLSGSVEVAVTHGPTQQLRVALDAGPRVTVPATSVTTLADS